MSTDEPGYFDGSRRLTGHNLYFAGTGAVLEVRAAEPAQLADWRARVQAMRAALGWDDGAIVALAHAGGAALALAAPRQRLLAATELNEWAWQGAALAALQLPLPAAPGHPATLDFDSARETLRRLAAAESRPVLDALVSEAQARGLPVYEDDDALSIGAGKSGRTWALAALAGAMPIVDWPSLKAIPTALVTGSNGKTTTVRLLAAMLAEAGRVPGYNCTDGVFVNGERLEQGDWSGPAGARCVLRDPRVEAAVLETARGGLLRRGLAVARADAAIVTNISADHFGEYGVHSLAQLAAAKLVVARALGEGGVLVLNGDDAALASIIDGSVEIAVDKFPVGGSSPRAFAISWFSLDDENPRLQAARRTGAATCAVAAGELVLRAGGQAHPLGAVAAMPLTLGGVAHYNIANAAGAALLAHALGVAPAGIAAVLARFGARNADNPGRLQRWRQDGVEILLDYAHNPDGLQGLLAIARGLAGARGRLGLLLGQAGNRDDEAIRALARIAAAAQPERVVLKDLATLLRGRAPGEVPALLTDELRRAGLAQSRLSTVLSEVDAARSLLEWARPGDVLVLPVHGVQARDQLVAFLDGVGEGLRAS